MLEIITKFICFIIMYSTGYLVIKKIVDKKVAFSKEQFFYIALLAIVSIFLHKVQYTTIYTITVFLLNIVVYKKIFKIDWSQSIIATSVFMVALTSSDLIVNTIFRIFWTQDQIRTDFFISIFANTFIGLTSIFITGIPIVYKLIKKFYENISQKNVLTEIIFFILLIIGFCNLQYNYAIHNITDQTYFANTIIIVIFTIITIIFIQSKNDYQRLSDEYDILFGYVQNFEEWIEKEQLNRHEYKNQLAVLRTIAKDKKTKEKIDEILEDNIKLKNEVISKLKDLPKGGLKGLMYYKAAIAQKQNIKLITDISIKPKSYLNKLSESQNKVLCQLIGIYFDNALEATVETKERYLMLEIYELKNIIKIILSNSFNKNDNIESRNEKGVTTKGEGHGNGLYFAKKILSKSKWLDSQQEITGNYYIQTLIIKKIDK